MRKIPIDRHNHLRAILTDTLPYEVPFFFGNEKLCKAASKDFLGLPAPIKRLLMPSGHTAPYTYGVQKSGGGRRRISIPHPAAQIRFAELYRDFDAFIENVCARSAFSLRHPTRVGTHFYQTRFASTIAAASPFDEEPAAFVKQRKWASSYFYYREFSHIYRFFSSDSFNNLEQSFSMLLKLDLARCFESIYTHSISWALRTKQFSKDNKGASKYYFESIFDSRMQDANWGETNGILIGPEVSRIFAEAILQSIDVAVEQRLKGNQGQYAIRRYVDDYFVFANEAHTLSHIKEVIEEEAAKFNLHLNESKTELIHRPLISSLTVARDRVISRISSYLDQVRATLVDPADPYFPKRAAERLVGEIRRIAKEASVGYAPLASPALAVICRHLSITSEKLGEVENLERPNSERALHSVLRLATFLFLMDIRAATSHKLAKLFLIASDLYDQVCSSRLSFETALSDSVRLSLDQAKSHGIHGPEIVNLLIASDAVCRSQRGVSESQLRSALGLEQSWSSSISNADYFGLVSTLYFARDQYSFSDARSAAIQCCRTRIRSRKARLHEHAEECMLFFDYITCPYISDSEKEQLLSDVMEAYQTPISPGTAKDWLSDLQSSVGFIAWEGRSMFGAMLERRELQPAYDG